MVEKLLIVILNVGTPWVAITEAQRKTKSSASLLIDQNQEAIGLLERSDGFVRRFGVEKPADAGFVMYYIANSDLI